MTDRPNRSDQGQAALAAALRDQIGKARVPSDRELLALLRSRGLDEAKAARIEETLDKSARQEVRFAQIERNQAEVRRLSDQGLSVTAIASQLGLSKSYVSELRQRFGIPVRGKRG